MTRDPRIDPRPGDILAKGGLRRRVYRVRRLTVDYVTGAGKMSFCARSTWESWARNATVLQAAPEPTPCDPS